MDKDKTRPGRYQIRVLGERCKGCRFCVEACPRRVLKESAESNSKGYHLVYAEANNECVNCGLCELICPDFAICVVDMGKEVIDG